MADISKGNCFICGAEPGKTAMKNHSIGECGYEGELDIFTFDLSRY